MKHIHMHPDALPEDDGPLELGDLPFIAVGIFFGALAAGWLVGTFFGA